MKIALLPLLLLPVLALGAAAPAPVHGDLQDLKGGRYSVKVTGFLCTACSRAAVAEIAQLKDIDEVKADFESQEIVIKVKLDHVVTISALKKALKRAARKVDLKTSFEIVSVRYRPA